jgi:hypothetical protein
MAWQSLEKNIDFSRFMPLSAQHERAESLLIQYLTILDAQRNFQTDMVKRSFVSVE